MKKTVAFWTKMIIIEIIIDERIHMFISQALAQTTEVATQTAGAAPMSGMLLQLILVVAIVYFILIRPQQKRIKKHEAELQAIIKGTKIVVGGLLGTVVEVQEDNKLLVELANGVRVTVLRPYVAQVFFETPLKK